MSASYTLHLPADTAPGDPRALERAELVRDGFSWGAFAAPTLWLLWHRHWLLAIGACAVVSGLAAGLWWAGAGLGAIVAAEFLLRLLFGLEGATLRRFSYERRRRPIEDVVLAANLAEAEAKTFARWLGPPEARPVPAPGARASVPYVRRDEPVIGLFPDMEGRR